MQVACQRHFLCHVGLAEQIEGDDAQFTAVGIRGWVHSVKGKMRTFHSPVL
jgi:hypothetical protein